MNRAFYIFLLMMTSCFSFSSFAGKKKNDDDTDRRAQYTAPARLKNEPRDEVADEPRQEFQGENKNERRNNQKQRVRSFWTPLRAVAVGDVLSFSTLEGTIVHPSQIIPYGQGYAGLVNAPNPEGGYSKQDRGQERVSWVVSDEDSVDIALKDVSSRLMRELEKERKNSGQENASLVVAFRMKFYGSSTLENKEDEPQKNEALKENQQIEKNDEMLPESLPSKNKEEDALNPPIQKDAQHPEKKEQKDDPSKSFGTTKEDPSSIPLETKEPEASHLVEKKQEAPLTQKVTRAKDKKK